MNESSILNPASMRAQSDAAISMLREENEHLQTANIALNAFIDDETNRGRSFENLRQKMQDFHTVSNAFSRANDADISDHIRIIATVGDERLVGSVILQQHSNSILQRRHAERMIARYAGVRNSVSLLQRLNPFDRTYSNARTSQRNWENIRDKHSEIIREMERKIAEFNRIDQATRNLFTAGNELRIAAKRGLEFIQEAAAGLPNSYDTEGLRAWRVDIALTKENFIQNRLLQNGATQEEIVFFTHLYEQFGFDFEAVRTMHDIKVALRKNYPNASVAEIEWRWLRLIGGFVYYGGIWNHTAGEAFGSEGELAYFTQTLGIPERSYQLLRYRVRVQNNIAGWGGTGDILEIKEDDSDNYDTYMGFMAEALGIDLETVGDDWAPEFERLWGEQFEAMQGRGDFAHQMITTATHLATDLNKTGVISNIMTGIGVGNRERIEWMSGWLGDATIRGDDGRPSFGPDDYIADLDAANIVHIMRTQGLSYIEAHNLYHSKVGTELTRAEMFLKHTPLDTVVLQIAGEFRIPINSVHLSAAAETILPRLLEESQRTAPDTYNFIRSLQEPEKHHEMWRPQE